MKHAKVIYKGDFYIGEGKLQTYTRERIFTDMDLAKQFVEIVKGGLLQQYRDKEIQILIDTEEEVFAMVEAFDVTLRHKVYLQEIETDINSLTSWL